MSKHSLWSSSELCPSVGIIVALTHFLCVWITHKHVVLLHAGGKHQAKRCLLWAARIALHGTSVLQEVLWSSVGLCSFWPPHQGRGKVRTRVWLPTTVIVLGASQCAIIHAVVKYSLQILQCASRVAYKQNESQKEACGWQPGKPCASGQPGIQINLQSNLCLLVCSKIENK